MSNDFRPTASNPHRQQRLKFREPDGTFSTVAMVTDSNGVIISVTPTDRLIEFLHRQAHEAVATSSGGHTQPVIRAKAEDPVPGITMVQNADGSITPVADETTIRNMEFFLPSVPCWFGGCEEMRKAYRTEEAKLFADDPNCPGCKTSALKRKYLRILSNIDTRRAR